MGLSGSNSEIESIFAAFERNMDLADAELKEIIHYADGTLGTEFSWSDREEKCISTTDECSTTTSCSSLTADGMYATTGKPVFTPGRDWNVDTEKMRMVCVRGSFAKELALTLNIDDQNDCHVGFIGYEEASFVDVDFLLQALKMLTIEREMFIQTSLDYVESTRNSAAIEAYIQLHN
jgi:hypothetical protein